MSVALTNRATARSFCCIIVNRFFVRRFLSAFGSLLSAHVLNHG